MDCFVKRFQPDRYDLWKIGKDVAPHPEDDQSKLYKHRYALMKASLIQMYLIINNKHLLEMFMLQARNCIS